MAKRPRYKDLYNNQLHENEILINTIEFYENCLTSLKEQELIGFDSKIRKSNFGFCFEKVTCIKTPTGFEYMQVRKALDHDLKGLKLVSERPTVKKYKEVI